MVHCILCFECSSMYALSVVELQYNNRFQCICHSGGSRKVQREGNFGVNHKNGFESATNVCENILSGSKYNLLGTSKAMASKSSHSNLKKLKSFEYCSFEVQRAYVKNSKPFTGGVLLKLTNKTYKIITVHFNERLKRT